MAWTQDQLDSLDEAIAQGTMTVSIAGKSVTYRSLDEMLRLRETMARSLGLSTTTTRKRATLGVVRRDK